MSNEKLIEAYRLLLRALDVILEEKDAEHLDLETVQQYAHERRHELLRDRD